MNKKGDHPSVGEELLKGVSIIRKHNDYMLE